jgi:hypothetical protein
MSQAISFELRSLLFQHQAQTTSYSNTDNVNKSSIFRGIIDHGVTVTPLGVRPSAIMQGLGGKLIEISFSTIYSPYENHYQIGSLVVENDIPAEPWKDELDLRYLDPEVFAFLRLPLDVISSFENQINPVLNNMYFFALTMHVDCPENLIAKMPAAIEAFSMENVDFTNPPALVVTKIELAKTRLKIPENLLF